jgi:ABC-type branched-subunit amino acid transport system substrate-binding protein
VAVALAAGGLAAVPTGAGAAANGERAAVATARKATGVGTEAATKNPNCDPATGRFRWTFYGAPPCVKEWKGGDNGGKVAQGVTADTVKTVVLWAELPAGESTTGIFVNQSTNSADPEGARFAIIDNNEVFKHVYETWGREVELVFVKSTGQDEAAQRADAVTVAAMKPFAVLDLASSTGATGVGGGQVFQQALENAGVPYVSPSPRNTPIFQSKGFAQVAAGVIADQGLWKGKAEYAGDAIKDQPRKLGILHSTNFDTEYFLSELKKRKVPAPVDAEFTVTPTQSSVRVDANAPPLDTQIPTLITKLKTEGVTTLVMMANHSVSGAASRAMKAQEWFPEIFVASAPYQDLDLYARTYDQEAWSHAFGLIWFPPYLKGAGDPTTAAFQWYWGTDQGTRWSIAFFQMLGLYSALQFIGPDVNADMVAKRNAIFQANGGSGGAYDDSIFTIEINPTAPPAITQRATALGWWDPDAEGPGNYNLGGSARGKYVYLNGGKRYLPGDFPKGKQAYFDDSEATVMYDAPPASEPVVPTYPCDDCPSSGATGVSPAAAAA